MMRASVVESVSRRGYWTGIALLMVVLSIAALWAGLYAVEEPEAAAGGQAIENADPLMHFFMYNQLGVVVITLVLQFILANVLFWTGAWAWSVLRRRGRMDKP